MPQRQPNLLLITTDQQRANALSLNGSSTLATPNLDYLGTSSSNFRHAYAECPSCIPARRTLISRTAVRIALHGCQLDGSKAQRDLGITYTSIDDGIDATLDWLHDTGLVDLPEDDGTDAGPSAGDEPA